jgi:hypothetical protein
VSATEQEHPCAERCQYAEDVAMPGHSCGHGCLYDWKAEQERDEQEEYEASLRVNDPPHHIRWDHDGYAG